MPPPGMMPGPGLGAVPGVPMAPPPEAAPAYTPEVSTGGPSAKKPKVDLIPEDVFMQTHSVSLLEFGHQKETRGKKWMKQKKEDETTSPVAHSPDRLLLCYRCLTLILGRGDCHCHC